jgi:hypothetical protein
MKVGVCLLLIIGFFTLVFLWSSRSGWSAMHRLALVGGGILTHASLGVFMEPESGSKAVFDHVGSILLALGAIFMFALAVRKLRKSEMTSTH